MTLDKNILQANLEIAQKRVAFFTRAHSEAKHASLKALTKKSLLIATAHRDNARDALNNHQSA